MSNRYKGGIISATPPTTTGGESGTASGAWTLEQQMQAQAAGLWPLQPTGPYIEDVFQTWLYTGTGAAQTITNGIDLAGKGGLVWIKWRSGGGLGSSDNALYDTTRGVNNLLVSNSTAAQVNTGTGSNASVSAFNSNGFSLGADALYGRVNYLNGLFASWTFREQPKFFDIVTYTGNGSNPRTISHNLGSTPGCIIFKSASESGYGWVTWHRSLNANGALQLQTTGAEIIDANLWGGSPTDTTFSVSSYSGQNVSGIQYVAYVFAHNAGGFGLSGTDNVISCGSYTGTGAAGNTITLGYEPQWVLIKAAGVDVGWYLADNMRGMPVSSADQLLQPNSSGAEFGFEVITPTATGFQLTTGNTAVNENTIPYIYIAIRRGPMRTPTTGTSVFGAGTRSGSGSVAKTNSNILTDLTFIKNRTSGGEYWAWTPRLAGNLTLQSNSTDAELTGAMATNPWDTMTGAFCAGSNGATNSGSLIDYSFRRAPGFHDVVCYTGNGSNPRTINHNLGVAPELMIFKRRNGVEDWSVYCAYMSSPVSSVLFLNLTDAQDSGTGRWNNTAPTSTVFSLGGINQNTATYVAYLFASCPGVSKVGSYTGTGTTQVINCGFTGGARFVMIKRADSTGDWFVWDTARGMVPANDPYLRLNTTAAEVTGTDFVDTAATGFEITSTAPAAINASGGTFIFLAIA